LTPEALDARLWQNLNIAVIAFDTRDEYIYTCMVLGILDVYQCLSAYSTIKVSDFMTEKKGFYQ